jgi:mannose-6-phosphate isomerase-like protein (cupin superfamily)
VVDEGRLEDYGSGLAPKTDGWFVVNVADACLADTRRLRRELHVRVAGRRVHRPRHQAHGAVARTAERLYHGEETQEDFLVLSGECLLLVEGEERHLRAWDFFHCAPGTEHIFVGAGDGAMRPAHDGDAEAGPPDPLPGLRARAAARRRREDRHELTTGGVRVIR